MLLALPPPRLYTSPARGRRNERGHEPRHVEGVDVVAHLLALVAEDPVLAPLEVAFDEVAQEPVELDAGVVRPGQAAAAQAQVGMLK